ncbi:MAG: hypothetical protein KDD29_02395 [Flavobacteriales bacterium]|nr:hypothetical protein [Flavobacteriales bacterium]MCB9335644.1 hypothetical protein [Flavobacteriales bacterium]
MNTYKKNEEKIEEKKNAGKVVKSLSSIFSGSFLSREKVISSIPFVFFLTLLGILYIANGYYSEKTVRELYKVGTELKELRSEYITIKSELNFQSKQSQVAQATIDFGVKESIIPPSKILVNKGDYEKITNKD